MLKRALALAFVGLTLAAAPAFAQEKRVEVSALFGWTFSDGVDGDPVLAGNGNIYDRIDPKDSFKFGLGVGVMANENVEVGFLFGSQMTQMIAGGTTETEIGDATINTYHGYVAYNLGDEDAPIRPYLLGGIGATNYGATEFTRANGQQASFGGETQFSTTWGAGVKAFPNPNVGVRFGVQWTPTYIKSDAAGYWCDPYWGCYLVGSAQYSNQWDLSGGITFRF
jgi:opacity protein-like surface antigen